MQEKQYKKTITLTVALIIINCFIEVKPALAQLQELATGALSILNSVAGQSNQSHPQQQIPPVAIPQQSIPSPSSLGGKYNVGTENFSGNTINFCISGCFPRGSQPVIQQPVVEPEFANSTPNSPPSAPVQPSSVSDVSERSNPKKSTPKKSTNYLPIDFSKL